jgi:hypothetical protein
MRWPAGTPLHANDRSRRALIYWARDVLRGNDLQVPTWRYAAGPSIVDRQVDQLTQELDARGTATRLVDLAVAAHRAITNEFVAPEATRMLLDAHVTAPRAVTHAVLVGVALHAVTSE